MLFEMVCSVYLLKGCQLLRSLRCLALSVSSSLLELEVVESSHTELLNKTL